MPNPLIDALHATLRRPTLLALGLLSLYVILAVLQVPAAVLLFLLAAVASVYAAHRVSVDHSREVGTILMHVGALLLALAAATLTELEHNGTLGVLGCAAVLAAPCLHARRNASPGTEHASWTTLLVVMATMTLLVLLVVGALNSGTVFS
jgi:hypothetical protein